MENSNQSLITQRDAQLKSAQELMNSQKPLPAKQILDDLIKKQPQDIEALYQRGKCYKLMEQFYQAEVDIQNAFTLVMNMNEDIGDLRNQIMLLLIELRMKLKKIQLALENCYQLLSMQITSEQENQVNVIIKFCEQDIKNNQSEQAMEEGHQIKNAIFKSKRQPNQPYYIVDSK